MVQILCTHVYKWKNVKTIPEMGGGRIKENGEGVNSSMIYCKNFCKCHNVPLPSPTIKKLKKQKSDEN
jgi:hypothetical protein